MPSSAALDDAFVTAIFAGLEGSDKPYVHTGGIWVFGDGGRDHREVAAERAGSHVVARGR